MEFTTLFELQSQATLLLIPLMTMHTISTGLTPSMVKPQSSGLETVNAKPLEWYHMLHFLTPNGEDSALG